MPSTALATKMVKRADEDGLPADHELRTRAEAFDKAHRGWLAEAQTVTDKELSKLWARAKAAWHVHTGEEA